MEGLTQPRLGAPVFFSFSFFLFLYPFWAKSKLQYPEIQNSIDPLAAENAIYLFDRSGTICNTSKAESVSLFLLIQCKNLDMEINIYIQDNLSFHCPFPQL
jgi:hypothetical protein